jgi:IPT/TIG domain/PQQ-like domain/S-layer homology domain
MNGTRGLVRSAVAATALFVGSLGLHAGELIFAQLDDNQSNHGPSNHAPLGPVDAEVADDFELTASIDRIVAYGFNFPNPVPDFGGAYVRFYASSGTGGPGALQSEFFLPAGDPNLVNGLEVAGWLDITLATPFSATGKHFVSVQPVTATAWYRWSANSHSVHGQPFYYRDPGSGVPNWQNDDGLGNSDTDIAFELYGTVTGAGHIDSLSAASLARSGYLEIFGTNFGGSGSVQIDGLDAPVADWADGRIVAYVPESAGLGTVSVQLTNGSGQASNGVSLDVTTRQADGRVQWRFRMDGPYAQVRPVLGPDGTIYAVDAFDHLYALTPDGGLKWLVRGAGGKGVAVGADGDVYTGSESAIRAFHSDGSEKWTFVQSPFAFILVGVAVGPDGNVYAAASEGMGVFSLTPDGDLRWQTPNPYDRIIIDYNEIVFGDNDGAGQLYFWANRRLRGITLSGSPVFSIEGGLPQLQVANSPAVGPDGSVHTALSSYSPDGDALWTFATPYPYNVFSKSSVGSDGAHYYVQNLSQLFALNPDGTVRWHAELDDYVKGPIVDPTDGQILLGGAATLDHPGLILSASTEDGGELWRVELPAENGFNQFVDSRARFRGDGLAVYIVTATATGDNATSRSFVYALDASLSGGPPQPPSPSVFAITPPSGAPAGGSAMTIQGSGYVAGATVSIGGAAATAGVVDPATIEATAPPLSPGTLNDLTVTNPDDSSVTVPKAWFADFLDVPQADIFHAYVEKIFRLGITTGCAGGNYCRDTAVTREQMAVFLIKGSNGAGYVPPACTGVFGDVPCPGLFTDWIEDLAAQGITGGCGGDNYCPSDPVTRAQMAVFLLKAEHGADYAPSSCAGAFGDVACPSLFADWIEQLAAEQITGGCGSGNYCPSSPSTRGQMAVFLVKALHLQ